MRETELARRLIELLRSSYGERSRQAKALLDWARDWQTHFWPAHEGEIDWAALPALAATLADEPSELADMLAAIADALALPPFDRDLLGAGVLLNRVPRFSALRHALEKLDVDILALTSALAGGQGGLAVRESLPFALGLFEASPGGGSASALDTTWTLDRLLDRGIPDRDKLAEALIGARQTGALPLTAFEGVEAVPLLLRLIGGALGGEPGINILIHGPVGSGKTELARSLVAAAGADLFAVGEIDGDGEEPTRFDRLSALGRAQRVLERRGGAALLFDEMEDLIGETREGGAGYDAARMGSKIFINRLLERNAAPVIWTSNAIHMIDDAHLRRMSFILKLDYPKSGRRAGVLARMAESESMAGETAPLAVIARDEPSLTAVARVALRAARIAGGEAGDAGRIAGALLQGLRGGEERPPLASDAAIDLDLFESEPSIASLVARVTAPGAPADFSMLLTGPPGTGKTALVGHVARGLDRPLHVKRASDLLSKWVGESEQNIAQAFAAARRDGAVLLFDEVDSLLFDRADATRSWEVTQVNELLTWMDSHALPFFAASNHPGRIDPAALRRFTFKLKLQPLSRDAAARAFARFFGEPAPKELSRLTNLTPGDFAVVKRQLRYTPPADPATIVALLEAEARAKPGGGGPMGF